MIRPRILVRPRGRYFFFLGAAFESFVVALALAFFLSLPCELLPFAMTKSFLGELVAQAPALDRTSVRKERPMP